MTRISSYQIPVMLVQGEDQVETKTCPTIALHSHAFSYQPHQQEDTEAKAAKVLTNLEQLEKAVAKDSVREVRHAFLHQTIKLCGIEEHEMCRFCGGRGKWPQ